MACKNPRMRLWQELALTLVLKGVLLALIWAAWFSAPQSRSLDAPTVATQILSPQPDKEAEHDAIHRTR